MKKYICLSALFLIIGCSRFQPIQIKKDYCIDDCIDQKMRLWMGQNVYAESTFGAVTALSVGGGKHPASRILQLNRVMGYCENFYKKRRCCKNCPSCNYSECSIDKYSGKP